MSEKELVEALEKAWSKRKDYIENAGLQAFRLITKEEWSWPMAVDIYSNGEFKKTDGGIGADTDMLTAVLQQYDFDFSLSELRNLEKVLKHHFGVERFFYKKRFRVKDAPEAGGDLNVAPVEMVIEEYGQKFWINLSNYLDTGLFLDHRDTRLWVKSKIEARVAAGEQKLEMLNMFAYTGSFSVYAAAGGAFRTHTVDLSKTYCDWARRNMDLNGYDQKLHWIYRMDAFEYYAYAERKKLTFDVIVIDPPTFSRNKGENFSVQRDHAALIEGAAKLLRPGGEIIFSNNCLDFVIDYRLGVQFMIENVQDHTVPVDFWVNPEMAHWDSQNQIHNCFVLRRKSS